MKRILSLLFNKNSEQWWTLYESDNSDPPNERQYMFTAATILHIIMNKLRKIHDTAKETDRSDV